MPLIIEQSFPLGRFHATRWKMGAFGDRYGEWPPSPWRLLRALANRWFQWSRETGGEDRNALDRMLLELSKELPEYYLPAHTARGEPLKQYLPVGLEEKYKYKKNPVTKKSELDYQYRDTATTLTDDAYRLIGSNDSVFWVWRDVAINDGQLLDELLARVLYFGRAESWTHLRRVEQLPSRLAVQSVRLHEKHMAASSPVLAPDPRSENRLRLLFEPTDHSDIKHRDIPPGTRWYYAVLPSPPRVRTPSRYTKNHYPENLTHIQFAIGGQVLPTAKYWCLLTEKFRKRALKELCFILTGKTKCDFPALDVSTKLNMRGFTGKDEYGEPLADHSQAYFSVLPDEDGKAARLVVWRRTPFSQEEVKALFAAALIPLQWDSASPKWKIKLLPLPFEMPLSLNLMGTSHRWGSVTPFVPPRQRRRFRKDGKVRPGETPGSIATKLCQRIYGITPLSVVSQSTEWVFVHLSARKRGERNKQRLTLPSFRLVIEFGQPVSGPIALGDSSHFGFGIFRPL